MNGARIFLATSVVVLLVGAGLERVFSASLSGPAYLLAESGFVFALIAALLGLVGTRRVHLGSFAMLLVMFAMAAAASEAFARGGIPDIRGESSGAFRCSILAIISDLAGACFGFIAFALAAFYQSSDK